MAAQGETITSDADSAALAHFDHAVRTRIRMSKPAHVVATALELVAPLPGYRFGALCCWCLERADRATVRVVPHARLADGGECDRCPEHGRDVLLCMVPSAEVAS